MIITTFHHSAFSTFRKARTLLITNIDPKLHLPQSLIDFFMKKVAGLMLYFLQKKASNVSKNPNGSHWNCIVEDNDFYRDWLLPKFEKQCRSMNWEMPNVAALSKPGSDINESNELGQRSTSNKRLNLLKRLRSPRSIRKKNKKSEVVCRKKIAEESSRTKYYSAEDSARYERLRARRKKMRDKSALLSIPEGKSLNKNSQSRRSTSIQRTFASNLSSLWFMIFTMHWLDFKQTMQFIEVYGINIVFPVLSIISFHAITNAMVWRLICLNAFSSKNDEKFDEFKDITISFVSKWSLLLSLCINFSCIIMGTISEVFFFNNNFCIITVLSSSFAAARAILIYSTTFVTVLAGLLQLLAQCYVVKDSSNEFNKNISISAKEREASFTAVDSVSVLSEGTDWG